ncbi:hypothetical protein L9F63_000451 [Diploptera punctata]|uniref:rRNA-processing protein EBP2 n=1 Tax=Diploptera punctata TaxID=6984 RepID=A0AAD8ANC8_DIPPU|nr:hypothetical protein L9F63_000451 [Diploptera punctata]
MSDLEYSNDDVESDSETELQEAFAKGLLKPGLNVEYVEEKKHFKNKIITLDLRLSSSCHFQQQIKRQLLVNCLPASQTVVVIKIQEEQLKHEAKLSQFKGKKKKAVVNGVEDPSLNDFRRETLFHRQAQAAVMTGIAQLKDLGVNTKRPDDYFAEMAKSDEHMHKVREHLLKKQRGQELNERVKQMRHLRKVGKQVQVQAKLKQASEKRELMEEVKKYRKGLRKDLDFLDDKKKKSSSVQGNQKENRNKKLNMKQKYKDNKFGFGGKKRGIKRNTKNSVNDVSEFRRPGKPKQGGQKRQRPGKNRRMKMKAKSKK